MNIEWNKVIRYSKIAAVVLFVGTFFPGIGFWTWTMTIEQVDVEVPVVTSSHDSEVAAKIEYETRTQDLLPEENTEAQAEMVKSDVEDPQQQSVTASPAPSPSPSPLPKPRETPAPVELAVYAHPSYHFSFQYPKTWNTIENTPPDANSLSFSRYPQESESLEIHMTVGEKLNMEQVVSSDAVYEKKETIVVAGVSVQKLTFEQFDSHGGYSGYMRQIHIAVPLPSGTFLNLLGVCSTVSTGDHGRCTTTIDDIMNTVVIPSIKI